MSCADLPKHNDVASANSLRQPLSAHVPSWDKFAAPFALQDFFHGSARNGGTSAHRPGKVSAQKASADRKACTIQLTKLPFGSLKGALLKLDEESGKC